MKKAVVFILALTMGCALMSGCGGGSESSGPGDAAGASHRESSDPAEKSSIEFSVMAPKFNEFDPAGTPVQKELMERLSEKMGREVTFRYTFYSWAQEYREKLNLAVNSGALPDLVGLNGLSGGDGTFQGSASLINGYGKEGMFACISNRGLPNYTSMMERCGPLIDYMYDQEGNCYFVPMFTENPYGTVAASRNLVIDKTVFDENQIAYPRTLDELLAAAKTLKERYPDSSPIIPQGGGAFSLQSSFAEQAFATRTAGVCGFDGEQYVIEGITEEYRESLRFCRDLYEANVIPSDYAAWTPDQVKAAKMNASAYIWFDCGSTRQTFDEYSKATGHEYLIIGYAIAETEGGWWQMRGANTELSANTWGCLAVSAASKHVDDCMELIGAYMSDDIFDLLTWGIEGESYTLDSAGNKVLKEEYATAAGTTPEENPKMALGIQINGGCMSGLFPVYGVSNMTGVEDKNTFVEWLLPDGTTVAENPYKFGSDRWTYDNMEPENCVDKSLPSLTGEELEEFSDLTAAMFTYISECLPKFIEGEMSLDSDWDAYVQECNKLCGGDVKKAAAIYNDKLEGVYYNK